MRRPLLDLSPLVLVPLVLAGACGGHPSSSIQDDLGRPVRVPPTISRVITLAPNLSEIVAAIGVEGKIVGTDDSSNYPDAIAAKPKVGGVEPSPERIASLRPDLVVASASVSHPGLAPVLGRLSIPLYVSRTDRLSDVPRTMKTLGRLLGAAEADGAVRTFDRGIEQQRRVRTRRPRILFMVWPDPLYIAGRETFIDDLIELTGAVNAVPPEVKGWPQYSLEAVMSDTPDLILYPAGKGGDRAGRLIAGDARWSGLSHLTGTSVMPVDEDLFSRPGPRLPLSAASLNAIIDEWESRR